MTTNITSETFDQQVLKSDKPSVVEVYTEHCPNCKVLHPIFDETANANKKAFNFYKLNATENLDVAKKYKVLGVPALLFFSHGVLVDRKIGVASQQKIKKRLEPLLDYSTEMAEKKKVSGYFKLPWK